MVKVNFIEPDGTLRVIEAQPGRSLMEVAVSNGIAGIIAECGGACSCATCHAYIGMPWLEAIGAAEGDEADMLEFAADRAANSRLTCQVILEESLNGIEVTVAPSQG